MSSNKRLTGKAKKLKENDVRAYFDRRWKEELGEKRILQLCVSCAAKQVSTAVLATAAASAAGTSSARPLADTAIEDFRNAVLRIASRCSFPRPVE